MNTILLQVNNQPALNLLYEMQALDLIKVLAIMILLIFRNWRLFVRMTCKHWHVSKRNIFHIL